MDKAHLKLVNELAQHLIEVAAAYPGVNDDRMKAVPKLMQAMMQAPFMFAVMNIQAHPDMEDLFASLVDHELEFIKKIWDWTKVEYTTKRIPKGPIL